MNNDRRVVPDGIDFDLERLTDIQLDTIRRYHPDHEAVNAEWGSRQPSPPAYTAPQSKTSAYGITAFKATWSSSTADTSTPEMNWEPTHSPSYLPGTAVREPRPSFSGSAGDENSDKEEPTHVHRPRITLTVPASTGSFLSLRSAPSLPEANRPSPLRQELIDIEDDTEQHPSARPSVVFRGSNRFADAPRPRSWVQELAAQNIIFNTLPVMDPMNDWNPWVEESGYDNNSGFQVPPNTPCSSDGEGDADEEDNVEEISKHLEEVHLEEENQEQDSRRGQETDEGADDEDSSFESAEPDYVFVNRNRSSGNAGPWNKLRAWNHRVRRGSRCPSPVSEENEKK
jgi:hypothetical protein